MYEGKAIVTMDKIKILTITTSGLKKKDGISTIILDSYEELDIEKYQIDITVAGEYDPGLVKAFENIEVCPRYLPESENWEIMYVSYAAFSWKKSTMLSMFMEAVQS